MRDGFKKSKESYKKKNFINTNSILLVFIFVLGLMVIPPSKEAHADEVNQVVDGIKPEIKVEYLGITPKNPMVGQDFTVRYEINPQPFFHNESKPKEIVLVLDKSDSMNADKKIEKLIEAANNFIDSLTTINSEEIPNITNLKIGIVSFSDRGYIEDELLEVTNSNSINKDNIKKLKKSIDSLKATGGTNTGDGLRTGGSLLKKSSNDANKTIIFMADGQPTYYSYTTVSYENWKCYCKRTGKNSCGRDNCTKETKCTEKHGGKNGSKDCNVVKENKNEYYTNIDSTKPSVIWDGNNNDDDGKCLDYATIIGNKIKDEKYNVFSIGYGLGSENSSSNKKMKQIHESMGGVSSGENNTFFATDTGAIDSVFKKIADTLEKSYAFNDIQLNINFEDSITVVSGFEVSDENGNKVKIEPIVYEINNKNQYTAKSQIIEFAVRAKSEGEMKLFKEESKLIYKDIYGNEKSVSVVNPNIIIRPFEATEAEKLGVDFRSNLQGYLIGDIMDAKVTFTHSGVENIEYNKAKFTLDKSKLPSNIKLLDEADNVLDFGSIKSTTNKDYKFKISEDPEITMDKVKEYEIKGQYSYELKKKNTPAVTESEERIAKINAKRGQVIVNVKDTEGNQINNNVKVLLKGNSIDKESSEIVNGVIKFDTVPTGDYNVKLTQIPAGYEFIDGEEVMLKVDYKKNIASYDFVLKKNGNDVTGEKITIEASDSSGKVNNIYNSEDSEDSRYDKFIKNEFNNEYKLFGESYADIKFSGEKLNYLQYQILKSDTNPTTMPTEGWKEIRAEDNGINEDIDLENQGKLTQKAYSVHHIPGYGEPGYNENIWKWVKNEEVYRYPFDGVRLVDASVAYTPEQYADKSIGFNPVTGEFEERWVPKVVFTNRIVGIGDSYREASKTWGYFRAPENGFYRFATHSDDGIRFSITTGNERKLLVDEFTPHSEKYHYAEKSIELKKGEFYPVFIEYFNVGEAAAFGIKYAFDGKNENINQNAEYKHVDPGDFFPSKSTTPGESSDGIFEGKDGMKFPEEDGKYYVAYRGFNEDKDNKSLIKEGFYGPFIVEDRFTLDRIVDNSSTNLNDDFKIKYTITPKDISITDVYKTKVELGGDIKSTLEIKNMHLIDSIPEGIKVNNIIVEPNNDNIITNIGSDNIEVIFGIDENSVGVKYDLIKDSGGDIEKAIYKAKPIVVTLDVSANTTKEYVFENKKGKLLYNDISLKDEKIMKESYFGETRFELRDSGSIDIKHIDYTPKEPTVGEVIDVNYQIVPKPFKAVSKAETDEIVLVLDASSSMAGEKLEKLKLDAKEFIEKFKHLNNNPKPGSIIASNTKITIVVYSDKASINPASGEGIWKDEILLDKYDSNLIRVIDEIKILPSSGENAGDALRKAEYALTHPERSDKDANKTIVVMSDGLPTNYSVDSNDKYYTEINNENPIIKGTGEESDDNIAKSTEYAKVMGNIIKEKGYSVYTIGHGLDDSKINKSIKDIHYSMGGLNSTLFSSSDVAIDKILEKMQYADYQRQNYIFKDVELKVTSGDGFAEVDGFGASESKSHTIKIPEIKYVLNETTKQYESAPIPIKFKIKADNPGKYPVLNPTSKNRLEYTDFDGQRVSMQVPNPEITVTDNIYEGIQHGLYEGITGNTINIMEKDNTVIAGGTNVNFGAAFVTKSNVPKITLTVDEKINSNDIKNKKVYKLKDNKLEEVSGAKITATGNKNVYDIVLPPGISKDTTILIRYSTKLPVSKDTSYTNNIKVGVSEKEAKVTTTNAEDKDRLPDLF